MPITFGAVGDIISVCLLVKDLVDALDKTRGSKAEYQSITRELWILDRVLLEIDLLARIHGGGATPELEALCETAKKAVGRCKELVSEFLKQIKKYQRSFGENGSKTNFIKETAMKVRWRIGEHDAVEKFRVEIAGTSSSLQMLLATASVKLMDIKEKNVKDHITGIQQKTDSSLTKQDAVLLSIHERIEDANRLITSSNSVTNKIADALRLEWLRQLGAELKGFMRRIIAMNIATYHAVISIQSALPSRLERGLIEEPFILEDAIGRVAPVHLQFVTSWDAFNAILEIRFRDMQGFKKVKQKQYGLQDKATGRDVEQSRTWQGAFIPGQRIDMSFIFDTSDQDSKLNNATCPGCQTTSSNPTDTDIQCQSCRMWFRRITIVQESDPDPQTPVPSPWRTKSEFGKSGFVGMVSGPVRPGKKRVRVGDVEGEDDVREFKRVRMIAKQRRIRQKQFGKARSGGLITFSTLSKQPSTKSSLLPRVSNKNVRVEDVFEGRTRSNAHAASNQSDGKTWEPQNVRRGGLFPQPASQRSAEFIEDSEDEEPVMMSRSVEHSEDEEEFITLRSVDHLEYQKPVTTWRFPEAAADIAPPSELVIYFNIPNLDPFDVKLKEVYEIQKQKQDGVRITSSWCSQSIHCLWPPRPVSTLLRITKHTDYDHPCFNFALMATQEEPYGTACQFPGTDTTFYGSAFGRFVFDWTCHLTAERDNVTAARIFWQRVYTLEQRGRVVMRSCFWKLLKEESEPNPYHGNLTKRQLAFSHFVVSYRCFWSHVSTLMEPDIESFSSLGEYMRIKGADFLDGLLFSAQCDRRFGNSTASKMLEISASYYDGVIAWGKNSMSESVFCPNCGAALYIDSCGTVCTPCGYRAEYESSGSDEEYY